MLIAKKTSLKQLLIFSKKKILSYLEKLLKNLMKEKGLEQRTIGNGVAIPHTKIEGLKKTQVLFIKLKSKIDFSASDEKFVDIIFSIITPETSQSEHLLILSSISNF